MARVILNGTGQATVKTGREQLKGYAKNRRDYDRRRRLNKDDPTTTAYKRLIRFDPCVVCGEPVDEGRVQDVDHIESLKGGGLDHWENMAPACRRCNRGRRDTPMLLYLLRRRDRC